MNTRSLENASFGDFMAAKVGKKLDAAEKWLEDDAHIKKAATITTSMLVTVAGVSELAANHLEDTRASKIKRAGLHVATVVSLAASGAVLHETGYELALNKSRRAKKRSTR